MSPGRVGMGEGQRAPGAGGRGHWLRCYTNVFTMVMFLFSQFYSSLLFIASTTGFSFPVMI